MTIKNALFEALAAALAGKLVAWPDDDFSPPTRKPYYMISWFPATPQRIHVGSGDTHRYIGIVQVLVNNPKGKGIDPLMTLAQEIVDAFPVDARLGPVMVRTKPAIGPAYQNGNFYSLPISIEYAGNMR